jgi:hypothetical protein
VQRRPGPQQLAQRSGRSTHIPHSAIKRERHLASLLRFLTAHGQHVRHLQLSSDPADTPGLAALQFPPSVSQLQSLALGDLRVSVSSDSGGQQQLGVLTGQSRLRKLSFKDIIDTSLDGLAAALRALPALQDLAVTGILRQALAPGSPDNLPFPGA